MKKQIALCEVKNVFKLHNLKIKINFQIVQIKNDF